MRPRGSLFGAPEASHKLDDRAPTLTVILSVGNHEPYDADPQAAGCPLHAPPAGDGAAVRRRLLAACWCLR